MPLIGSVTILRILSLVHVAAAYYLVTNPSVLPTQNSVLLLGSSVRLPDASDALFSYSKAPDCFSAANPAAAFAGILLAIFSLGDLIATALPEFAYDEYWSAQVSLRVLFWFVVVGWVYVTGRGMDAVAFRANAGASEPGSGWDGLKNGLVFTWAFGEMLILIWVRTSFQWLAL